MKVVVTGATGFVGRNVVNELVNQSIEVIAVGRSDFQIPDEWNEKVTYVKVDLFNEEECKKLLDKKADVFFHFAWAATSGNMRGNVDLQLENVKCSCYLMKLAKEMGCARFVYAGSIMEYEVMDYISKDDAKPSLGMIYSTAKLTADYMLKSLAGSVGIEYVNVLISNIYGVGEKSARFLNTMLRKMLNNEAIELTHCKQIYDFIYITDAAEAIVAAGINGKNLSTYYIGNKNPLPLKEFIEIMMKVTDSESELLFGIVPYNNAMLTYKEFDTGKLENELGIKPKYSFELGVKKTMQWILSEEM